MNRKTAFEVGAILSALLFFFGLISKTETRAIYVSASFLIFFLDLCLLIKREKEDGEREESKESDTERKEREVNFVHEASEEENKNKFAPAYRVYPLEDCRIRVLFENGATKIYDLRLSMRKHEELKILLADQELFQKARITVGGYRISWTGELFIAATEVWKNGSLEEKETTGEEKAAKEKKVKSASADKAEKEPSPVQPEEKEEKKKSPERAEAEKDPVPLKKTEEKQE
jgi:hypothetical protein